MEDWNKMENWKKELRWTWGSLYYEDDNGHFCRIINEIDDLEEFIEKQLKKERREVIDKIYNFVDKESGKSGRKEILEFLSKLKQ